MVRLVPLLFALLSVPATSLACTPAFSGISIIVSDDTPSCLTISLAQSYSNGSSHVLDVVNGCDEDAVFGAYSQDVRSGRSGYIVALTGCGGPWAT